MNFQTSDYDLICTLQCLGFAPIGQPFIAEKNRAFFEFTDSGELKEVVRQFWNGQLKVEPTQFRVIQKQIKRQIEFLMKGEHGK